MEALEHRGTSVCIHLVRGGDDVVTQRSRELDLLVAMSNDVPPLSHARRSIAMIQFPFRARNSLRERVLAFALDTLGRRRGPAALGSYDRIICNSRFTCAHIERRLGVSDAVVIAPPVDQPRAPLPRKESSISVIGRFVPRYHHKRHDVLIHAFGALHRQLGSRSKWELHLVGGATEDRQTQTYLARLHELAKGLPVHFHVNATAAERDAVLGRSPLFWHATGFGEREHRHPERMEHFGTATVEAMAFGAVPLVVPAGGQPEIVTHGQTGYHWNSVNELTRRSAELIANPAKRERISSAAREAARPFGKSRFLDAWREQILASR